MNIQWWRNRTIIITGASSGIGMAVARRLAQPGIRLGLVARRTTVIEELAGALRSRGAQVVTANADVTDLVALRSGVAEMERQLGPCEIVIANAGVHHYTPGPEFSAEAAAEVVRTNLIGVTNTIGSVLPGMVARRRGQLVAIASIAGVLGLPRMGTYCATKAAVVTQMNALAIDLRPLGIRVSTICPGFVDTPLIKTHNQRLLIFKMPVERAAERIIAAIERGKRICYFPWQTYFLARLGTLLPFGLYARLMRRVTNRARLAQQKTAEPSKPESR